MPLGFCDLLGTCFHYVFVLTRDIRALLFSLARHEDRSTVISELVWYFCTHLKMPGQLEVMGTPVKSQAWHIRAGQFGDGTLCAFNQPCIMGSRQASPIGTLPSYITDGRLGSKFLPVGSVGAAKTSSSLLLWQWQMGKLTPCFLLQLFVKALRSAGLKRVPAIAAKERRELILIHLSFVQHLALRRFLSWLEFALVQRRRNLDCG